MREKEYGELVEERTATLKDIINRMTCGVLIVLAGMVVWWILQCP